MDEEKVQILFDTFRDEFGLKSIDGFKNYLSDPTKRKMFYDEVIQPRYPGNSFEAFENLYGLKKNENFSQDTDSPSGSGTSGFFDSSKEGFATEVPKGEGFKKFKSALKTTVSGLARLPVSLRELDVSIRQSLDPEFKKEYNKLSVEDREKILSTTPGVGISGKIPTPLIGVDDTGEEVSEYYGGSKAIEFSQRQQEQANIINESLAKFETSIGQDLFSIENTGRGTERLINEVVGAIPSLVLAMTPGGIYALGASAGSGKSRTLQEEGEDLTVSRYINAVGTGVAEGYFEKFTRGLGNSSFKILKQLYKEGGASKVKESFTSIVYNFLKGFNIEGTSEVMTDVSERALDLVLTGDEKAFENFFLETADTYIIGGAAGGPVKVAGPGMRLIQQQAQINNLGKKVSESEYSDLVNVFKPETGDFTVDISKLPIVEAPNSELFLNETLKREVKKGKITQLEMQEIMDNYNMANDINNELKGAELSDADKNKAASLLQEQITLQELVKDKNPALFKKQRDRIAAIDQELEIISETQFGIETEQQATREEAEKALLDEGVESPTEEQVLSKLDEIIQQSAPVTTTIPLSDTQTEETVTIDSTDKKLEKAGYQVSKDEKSEFLQDIKERGLDESSISYEIKEITEAPLIIIEGIEGTSFAEESFEGGPTADITVTYTNPDGTTESFDSTVALEPFVETEQVTQEEVVEETYTLPENPKERVADFEIIDNRKGQEGFEIDEEGNGKWIIRNIKTGKILSVQRKSDAEAQLSNIKKNENTFDYGEGEVIIEEFQTTEKQTPPPKPKKEKTKEEPTEIDKTVDELGSKGVDKIDAKILKFNFGNAYAYIKNTLARGKGVINVMQEQLRSAPTTAVDYILGNENSTLFYRKLFLPLVKSYQQYVDRFRQKEKVILESQDSLLKESKGNRNKAKINGYRIAIAQKAKIHEANPDSDVTPPVLDMLNFTIRLGKAGKLMGVNRKTALALEKLRDEYIQDGGITFENVYNSLTPTQKKVYNLLQEENSKLEPFALKAAERRGLTLEMLNDYSHRVVVGTRNEEIDIADKQAKDFSGETTRGKNLLERTEGVKAVSFDPFLSSLRGTQEVYLDYYMSPDVSNVQKIAAGLVKKYENGNDGQVAATIGIEETIRELLRVSYLRSFVPSGYGTTIATEAKRIGYRLLLGSAPRFAAELAGNSAMLMAEKPSVVMDAVTKYGSFSMKVGAKANNKYINMLTELGSGETDKLGGRLEADSKYSDRSGILNISQGERGLYNNFLNKLDQLTRLPKKLTYDNIAKASDFLMAGGDRVISRPIWVSKFANGFKANVKEEFGETIDITVKDLDEIAAGKSKYLTDSKYKKAIDKAVRDADRTVISISTSANPFNAIAKNVKRGDVKDYYRTINSFMANFTLNEYATARQAIGALVNSGEMSSRRAGFLLTGVLARMSSYVIAYGLLADLLDEEILNAPDDDDEELDSLIYRQLIGSVMTLMFRQNLGNIPSLPVNLGIEEFNKQYLDELRDGKPYNSYDNSIVYSLMTLDRLDQGIDKQILPILTGPYVEYYKTARRAIELYNRTQTRKTKEARDRAVKELEEVIVPQIIGQLGFIPLYKDYIRAKRKKFYSENYDRSSGNSGGGSSLPPKR